MSTRKGGGTHKGSPAHQNSFAFHHNKKSKKTKKIYELKHHHLCTRCQEIIEWRKKYRKYKPLKRPKKCTDCHQLNIVRAYHVLCDSCANRKNVCAKCLKSENSGFNSSTSGQNRNSISDKNKDENSDESDIEDEMDKLEAKSKMEDEDEDDLKVDLEDIVDDEEELHKLLEGMKERRRRTILRNFEKGEPISRKAILQDSHTDLADDFEEFGY